MKFTLCHDLTASKKANKGIDWIRIADRIGRPFSIDINFIRRVCVYYYECIAPIVSLWLWEVELVRARQNVIKCCEAQGRHPMERLVRGQTPSQKCVMVFHYYHGEPLTFNDRMLG